MKESLKTRIDFMWFCNFGLATNKFVVPDETTCRFRNKLIKNNLLENLLSLVNKCLEDNNLKVKISHGAILDATFIESSVNSKAKSNIRLNSN
jgi:IS5 family transposase